MPGRPSRRRKSHGATTPSEVLSARVSMAARATPASSRACGSRPTTWLTASRPASSELRSASETAATARPSSFWARKAVASNISSSQPSGSQERIVRMPTVTTSTDRIRRPNETMPASFRCAGLRSGVLRRASQKPISLPNQMTGWPIVSMSRCG